MCRDSLSHSDGMNMPTDTRRLRHLAIELNPCEARLTPYHIAFTREESPPVTSTPDDGLWYTHPNGRRKF